MGKKSTSNRREFITGSAKSAIALGIGAAMPTWVPFTVLGAEAPSEKLVIGIIGQGWRGSQLMHEAMRNSHIRIAAIADLDLPFLLNGLQTLDEDGGVKRTWIEGRDNNMKRPSLPKGAVDPYLDYRYLLDRKDIDAVMIAVPDHWHAKLYIDAMDAGKDVYGEKPLSLTIKQGRAIVRKARETKKIFQTGSQQRSDEKFRRACEYVRSGRLGKIDWVRACIGGAPQTQRVPDEPVPPGLNWDKWLGQTPVVPFNRLRCHVEFRWFYAYSGGMVTDWGAHHCDIAQWGLGKDGSGPKTVEGTSETKPGFYETFTNFEFKFTYADGVVLNLLSRGENGVTFHGPKGEIFVTRGRIRSNPEDILKEPLKSDDVHLYKSDNHLQNWVDCIKSRELPITDVEIGHRSVSVSHLANICGWTKRKLEWNPEKEEFVNDAKANKHLDRPQRKPYDVAV